MKSLRECGVYRIRIILIPNLGMFLILPNCVVSNIYVFIFTKYVMFIFMKFTQIVITKKLNKTEIWTKLSKKRIYVTALLDSCIFLKWSLKMRGKILMNKIIFSGNWECQISLERCK